MSHTCPNGHQSEAGDYCDVCGSPIDASAQPAAPTPSSPYAAGPASPSTPGAAAAGSAAPTGSSLDLDPSPGPTPAPGEPGEPGEPGAPETLECPNCQAANPSGALFCEACGYDFTTGAMPRDAATTESSAQNLPDAGAAGSAPSSGAGTGFDWLAEVWVDPDWYETQEPEDPCPSPGLPVIVPLRTQSALLGRVSQSRNTRPEIDLSSDPGVSRRHAQLTTDGKRWFVEDLASSNGTFVGPASGPMPEDPIAVGPRTELGDDDRLYVGAWTRVVVRRATPDEVETYA